MKFKSAYSISRELKGSDYAFVFNGNNLLVNNDNIPLIEDVSSLLYKSGLNPAEDCLFFGTIGNVNCYAFDLPELPELEGEYQFTALRRYIIELNSDTTSAAVAASHLLHWHRNSIFCGQCGGKNNWHERECAKRCPVCDNVQYPKISPAIIIMIRKDNKILLAHNSNFPEGRYSLLAGFMEIGETIEQTAAREVMEECSIEIENIRYLSSQSWPFPDSLMIGLTADYKSGDIVPDGKEIVHAGWYDADNFPSLPGPGTIARKIIDIYTKTYKS